MGDIQKHFYAQLSKQKSNRTEDKLSPSTFFYLWTAFIHLMKTVSDCTAIGPLITWSTEMLENFFITCEDFLEAVEIVTKSEPYLR